jgi:hypothetical protein
MLKISSRDVEADNQRAMLLSTNVQNVSTAAITRQTTQVEQPATQTQTTTATPIATTATSTQTPTPQNGHDNPVSIVLQEIITHIVEQSHICLQENHLAY